MGALNPTLEKREEEKKKTQANIKSGEDQKA